MRVLSTPLPIQTLHHVSRDSHDTYHLVALQAGRRPSTWNQTQGSAQCVLIRPKLLRRGLTDDHDRRSGARLFTRKIAASHDGDLEHPEIFGRDAVVGRTKGSVAIRRRYPD